MGAKQVRFAKGGKHCKERLRAANFLAKILKGVRQSMADRETKVAKAKREGRSLAPALFACGVFALGYVLMSVSSPW